jgi:uncharacterized protein YjbJ (UPF0337 family)
MSRTITALFDTRADAEAGRERLLAADVEADNVRIHDQSSLSEMKSSGANSTSDEPGIWALIKNAFLPDEDRRTYEEGVRRGGFLLTADVDGDEVDDAVEALQNADPVDIDERAGIWKSEGWSAPTAGTPPVFFDDDADRKRVTEDEPVTDNDVEPLFYGEREMDCGGGKVRSYVNGTPAHDQFRRRDDQMQSRNSERDPAYGERAPQAGSTLLGMGDEAIGSFKQGLGSLTGDDNLKRSGEAQERNGEAQQNKVREANDS